LGGLLFTIITVNRALNTSDNPGQDYIVGGELMKLLTDIDTLLI
jgi:hypothetical protein